MLLTLGCRLLIPPPNNNGHTTETVVSMGNRVINYDHCIHSQLQQKALTNQAADVFLFVFAFIVCNIKMREKIGYPYNKLIICTTAHDVPIITYSSSRPDSTLTR